MSRPCSPHPQMETIMASTFNTTIQFKAPPSAGATFAITGLSCAQLLALMAAADLGLEAYEPPTDECAVASGEIAAMIADIREIVKA